MNVEYGPVCFTTFEAPSSPSRVIATNETTTITIETKTAYATLLWSSRTNCVLTRSSAFAYVVVVENVNTRISKFNRRPAKIAKAANKALRASTENPHLKYRSDAETRSGIPKNKKKSNLLAPPDE